MRSYATCTLQLAAKLGCTAAEADSFSLAFREAQSQGANLEDGLRRALLHAFPDLSAEGHARFLHRFGDADAREALARLAGRPPVQES